MRSSIKNEERFLLRFCSVARFFGWVLLAMSVIGLASVVYLIYTHFPMKEIQRGIEGWLFGGILPALFALGLAQWLRYIMEPSGEPGWLLRRGHWVCLAFAVLFAVRLGMMFYRLCILDVPDELNLGGFLLTVLTTMFPVVTKTLILLGLALLLRRLMPILDEAKTLA